MSIAEPKTKRKPKTVSVETLRSQMTDATDDVRMIPLDLIERHPANRVITPESVQDLAESIKDHGQRDAARVRSRPDGKFTVLSGERRFQACKVAGVTHLKAIVINCSDEEALAEVALGNASRKDLDPIERAELLERLMRPVTEGGSGLDRLAAGKLFGLESDSGVKNAVRLLELPESIRALIRSGDLPERAARRLVPFAKSKPVIDAIAADIDRVRAKQIDSNHFEADGEWQETLLSLTTEKATPYWIEEIIEKMSRPWDTSEREWDGKGKYRTRCFPDDHDCVQQLEIVEFPGRDRPWVRCMNIKLWDKVNAPYAAAIEEDAASRGSRAKKNSKSNSAKPELTEAEKKLDEKRRKKEAEDRLNNYSEDWIGRMLRVSLIDEASDQQIVKTLPWLMSRCSSDISSFASVFKQVVGRQHDRFFDCDEFKVFTLWRLLLWPVALVGKSAPRMIVKPGDLPDRLPGYVTIDEIHELAKFCGCSIESAWKRAATADSDHRRLLAAWLLRHTKDQLQALRTEINCMQGSATMGRDELAECILAEHRPGKPLPLPKRLQPKKGKK